MALGISGLLAHYSVGDRAARLWRAERDDLGRLVLAIVLVSAGWWLAGWRWDLALAKGDLKAQLHWYSLLAQAGGAWQEVRFDPYLMGGVPLHDTFGTQFILQWLVWLGFRDLSVSNLLTIYSQVCWGYLGAAWVRDLAARLGRGRARSATRWWASLSTDACLVAIFAFAPLLAIRIAAYHINLIFGALAFVLAAASLTRGHIRHWTVTHFGFCVFALMNIISTYGHQAVLYSLYFGAPVFLVIIAWPALRHRSGLAHGLRRSVVGLAMPGVVVVTALLFCLPRLLPMLEYAWSTDMPRYDSTVYPWQGTRFWAPQWLKAMTWHTGVFAGGGGHERLFPLGPVLLGLLVLPWRRFPGARWALALVLAMLLVFTLRLEPLASLMLQGTPALRFFQISGRSLMILVPMVYGLGLAGLLSNLHPAQPMPPGQRVWPMLLALACSAAGVTALLVTRSPGVREALLWTGVALWLVARSRIRILRSATAATVVLFCLAIGSWATFSAHYTSAFTRRTLVVEPQQAGDRLKRDYPQLASHMNRVFTATRYRYMGVNSGTMLGIATSSGYSNFTSRMRRFLEALRRKSYAVGTGWWPNPGRELPVFNALYNVHGDLLVQEPSVSFVPRPGASGAAWFPTAVSQVADFPALLARLTSEDGQVRDRIRETALLVTADPLADRFVDGPLDPGCSGSRVDRVEPQGQDIVVTVDTSVACLLVVASNFVETRRATSGGGEQLRTMPVFGTLLGVWLPAGTSSVTLDAHEFPGWIAALPWTGGLLFLFFLGRLVGRNSRSSPV